MIASLLTRILGLTSVQGVGVDSEMNIHRIRKFMSKMGKPISIMETIRLWKFNDFMRFIENGRASKRRRKSAKEVLK